MGPTDRTALTVSDYAAMTDIDIYNSVRDNLSLSRYAQSMQTDGRFLQAFSDVSSEVIRRAPLVSLAYEASKARSDVLNGLDAEIARTQGLEAIALTNVKNGLWVLDFRLNTHPYGGYSVKPSESYGPNYDGIHLNDGQGFFINYDGSRTVREPTLEDQQKMLRNTSVSQPIIDPDVKLGIVIGPSIQTPVS